MADNTIHALSATATANLTFNNAEEDAVIRDELSPEDKKRKVKINIFQIIIFYYCATIIFIIITIYNVFP